MNGMSMMLFNALGIDKNQAQAAIENGANIAEQLLTEFKAQTEYQRRIAEAAEAMLELVKGKTADRKSVV